MQHAVGGPLPPPEQTPSGTTGTAPEGAAQAGPPPVPGAPVPQAPPPPGPYAPPEASRLGVHPTLHPGQSPQGTRAPLAAPPVPGWGVVPGAVPQPPVTPPHAAGAHGPGPHSASHPVPHPAPHAAPHPAPHRVDPTGHLSLPPGSRPLAPLAPPVEYGGGTGAATLAVLLIGPAGAGKTTVARHWAQRRRVPTAHISLDDVREWVCSGFADPQSGWNEHSEAQYRLARRTCGFAARNFLANGISCIVDDAVFPDRPVVGLGGWKRHVGPGLLPVVLLPGLEVVLERNAERSGNRRLSDEEVAAIHGRMAGWYGSGLPIIDNSTYDVETTARVLDDVLARAIASPPAW
ncbi:AAA family ATPase [Streptomyces sp. NPDC056144]|uniref:AAA family ATPase n=1 Tax=unclassified Streptomyces TaxID=2593676 RepID=UPI0035D914A5